MKKLVVSIVLILLCTCASVACADQPGQPQAETVISSLKVRDLDSFHERASGQCFSLSQGVSSVEVVIIAKDGMWSGRWLLDAASSHHLQTGVSIGSCLLYAQIHYQVAPV